MKTNIALLLLVVLAGCGSSPERKQIEQIAKRNPLDMANEDAKVVVLNKSEKKPHYPKVPTVDANAATYVSGKNSKIYHLRGCDYIGKDSLTGFASWTDAERSGRLPCEFCKPRDGGK